MPIGLKRGCVALLPHDPDWEAQAQETVRLLKEVLGADAVDIQHVGSTSIRGIYAKPILDISVGCQDFAAILAHNDALREKGVVFRRQTETELLYVCGDFARDTRTHHIHVVRYGGCEWNDYLNFRDYLNSHDDDAQAYSRLKQELLKEFAQNREGYTAAKAPFIDRVLQAARIWREKG